MEIGSGESIQKRWVAFESMVICLTSFQSNATQPQTNLTCACYERVQQVVNYLVVNLKAQFWKYLSRETPYLRVHSVEFIHQMFNLGGNVGRDSRDEPQHPNENKSNGNELRA